MNKCHVAKYQTLFLFCGAALAFGCVEPAAIAPAIDILLSTDDYAVSETTDTRAIDTITNAEEQLQDDDDTVGYTLPFTFSFYGTDYTTVYASTNSHVWFGSDDSDYDETLDYYSTPVAVAWNDDLDSYYYGEGLRIQAFTNPDRVVFDWDTESHSDADYDILNQLQIVIYATGEIVFHYIDFDPDVYCDEVGSGIANVDSATQIDLSDLLGVSVCDLAGRSFSFMPL